VAVNAPALPGVTPRWGCRGLPEGEDFAHVVGYVGPVRARPEKIERPDPLLQIPRFQIGKVGVEASSRTCLRGKAGTKRVEVNAAGRVMRELDRARGAGRRCAADRRPRCRTIPRRGWRAKARRAVVMDCQTGDLLASPPRPASTPTSSCAASL
jgi:penicillin-binding protein 2